MHVTEHSKYALARIPSFPTGLAYIASESFINPLLKALMLTRQLCTRIPLKSVNGFVIFKTLLPVAGGFLKMAHDYETLKLLIAGEGDLSRRAF